MHIAVLFLVCIPVYVLFGVMIFGLIQAALS